MPEQEWEFIVDATLLVMQIGVADPAGLNANDGLTRTGIGNRDGDELDGSVLGSGDNCFAQAWHGEGPSSVEGEAVEGEAVEGEEMDVAAEKNLACPTDRRRGVVVRGIARGRLTECGVELFKSCSRGRRIPGRVGVSGRPDRQAGPLLGARWVLAELNVRAVSDMDAARIARFKELKDPTVKRKQDVLVQPDVKRLGASMAWGLSVIGSHGSPYRGSLEHVRHDC